jgi:tetratricopeptide (TPR) repeat protein
VKLVGTVGGALRKPDEALGLLTAAEAAVVRAGSPRELRIRLSFHAGELYNGNNEPARALARFDEAKRLLLEAGADQPGSSFATMLGSVLLASATAYSTSGDHERAVLTYHEVIASHRRTLGPDSRNEARAWHNLGDELTVLGKPEDGVAAYREAVRIWRGRPGEPARLAFSMVGLATALQTANRWDEAFSVLEEAVRISREKMAPDDPKRTHGLIALGNAYMQRKRWRDAASALEEAIAFYERTGAKSSNHPITLFNRGDVELRQRRFAAATVWYDKAIAAFERTDGPQSRYLVFPLEAKGRALVELRRFGEAFAPLERAIALTVPAGGEGSAEQASARFHRGRALVESGVDRDGGLDEARAGRAALAALGADPQVLAPLDEWLDKRGVARPAPH